MEKIDRYYLEITSINNLKVKDKPSDKTTIELVDNKNYEITLLFSNNAIITLTAEIVEVVLEDQNIKNG